LSSDGSNSYKWDAENRLIEIDYPGSGNNSVFSFDGKGRNVGIVETTGGTVTSRQQFIWCGQHRCECRDASGLITAQFFAKGEVISGTFYYYFSDHLGSVCEMTDSSGTAQADYRFDPFGRVTKSFETTRADFQYAGYYTHERSSLALTLTRAYSPVLGRWTTRDAIKEVGGLNLFAYVSNAPTLFDDPRGEDGFKISIPNPFKKNLPIPVEPIDNPELLTSAGFLEIAEVFADLNKAIADSSGQAVHSPEGSKCLNKFKCDIDKAGKDSSETA
jgi:RHS repeat-associated protein